ncbi:hypothetical protein Q7P35_008217 [Cladosporium inversicolor]
MFAYFSVAVMLHRLLDLRHPQLPLNRPVQPLNVPRADFVTFGSRTLAHLIFSRTLWGLKCSVPVSVLKPIWAQLGSRWMVRAPRLSTAMCERSLEGLAVRVLRTWRYNRTYDSQGHMEVATANEHPQHLSSTNEDTHEPRSDKTSWLGATLGFAPKNLKPGWFMRSAVGSRSLLIGAVWAYSCTQVRHSAKLEGLELYYISTRKHGTPKTSAAAASRASLGHFKWLLRATAVFPLRNEFVSTTFCYDYFSAITQSNQNLGIVFGTYQSTEHRIVVSSVRYLPAKPDYYLLDSPNTYLYPRVTPLPITTSNDVDRPLLDSSPPEATELREATLLLDSIDRSSTLETLIKRYIERVGVAFERTTSEVALLRKENIEFRELLQVRKERKKGMRVAVKGKLVFNTKEILKLVEEAKAEASKGKSKKRRTTRAKTPEIEDGEEEEVEASISEGESDFIIVTSTKSRLK